MTKRKRYTYELYNIDEDSTERLRDMSEGEAKKRNSILHLDGETVRWVKDTEREIDVTERDRS